MHLSGVCCYEYLLPCTATHGARLVLLAYYVPSASSYDGCCTRCYCSFRCSQLLIRAVSLLEVIVEHEDTTISNSLLLQSVRLTTWNYTTTSLYIQ